MAVRDSFIGDGRMEEVYCAPGCVGPGTGLGKVMRGVGICKLKCYICSVDREPQLGIIGSNCRCSSVMET